MSDLQHNRPDLTTPGVNEETITNAVIASFGAAADHRLRATLHSLVRHLHAFAREVELTEEELHAGIGFLTAVGQRCDASRQEFILLSDVLGLSVLVDAIANRRPPPATASTVLGPFHVPGAPDRELGEWIAQGPERLNGEPTLVRGRVASIDGSPLRGTVVDVWQASPAGLYDVQDPAQESGNLRGVFRTDDDGGYRFRTVAPAAYPIPDDGPVGQLLNATGRHPMRPAHIHFLVRAQGHAPLVTHIFPQGGAYLDSDAVFGVKDSLVLPFRQIDDPDAAARAGLPCPFHEVVFDIVLAPIGS